MKEAIDAEEEAFNGRHQDWRGHGGQASSKNTGD